MILETERTKLTDYSLLGWPTLGDAVEKTTVTRHIWVWHADLPLISCGTLEKLLTLCKPVFSCNMGILIVLTKVVIVIKENSTCEIAYHVWHRNIQWMLTPVITGPCPLLGSLSVLVRAHLYINVGLNVKLNRVASWTTKCLLSQSPVFSVWTPMAVLASTT